jgi:hypothetical protein
MQMVRLVCCFGAAVLLLFSCKGKQTATAWQQMELKGKVKTMVRTGYRLVHRKKSTDTVMDFRVESRFNNRGYLVLEVNYDEDKVLNRTVFFFDGGGRPAYAKKYNGDSSFCYKTVFVYDKDGQVVMKKTLDIHDSVHLSVASKYGNNGRLNSEDSYWGNDIVLHRYRWLYNDKGLPAVFYQLRNDSSQLLKIAYSYNDSGERIEEKRFDGDDSLALRLLFSYPAHDVAGNWLQQLVQENNKPTDWVTREITYF